MPDSTSQGITYPVPGDLVRNPSMAAQLASDMGTLARTADDAIRAGDSTLQSSLNESWAETRTALTQQRADFAEALDNIETAYDVAVSDGFEGTPSQWLESLIGPRGPVGPYGGTEVTDPQVASYVEGATETREALDGRFIQNERASDLSLNSTAYGSPMGAATGEQTATAVRLFDEITAVRDYGDRIIDGAQFFTMLRVGDRPGTWIDEYYGWVSGHGGYIDPLEKGYTWLVTAPSPYGPWTFYDPPLIGTGPEPLMESHVVGPRTSAPHAMWVGDEIWLTYHGGRLNAPWEPGYDYTNRWGAPSVLAKSTDGIHFEEHGIVVDLDRGVTAGSPYEASTSYRRTIRHNGLWHSVWQANTTRRNAQAGIQTYSVGHATSTDGINWTKRPPLVTGEPGDQGLFSPSMVKVAGGWLIVCTYRRNVDGSQVGLPRAFFAEDLRPGAFRSLGDITLPEREGRAQRQVQSPFFFMHDGQLHMAYGATVAPSEAPVISIAKVGWQ